ncbi:MAG: peptidase T [Oscillospiraceae bacterium]|nr:peptidase T [Oscillospiraceae bacterium]
MEAYERLIKYARVHSASIDDLSNTPSTQIQFDLAHMLEKELIEMGAKDVFVDEHCYVYAKIPASEGCENAPTVGFNAHLDTIPDFSGENVRPRFIESYVGGDIVLGDSGRILSPTNFPHLPSLKGKGIVVTDGTTVLGADDKAGVAEIMCLAERLLASSEPHGEVAISFSPDEEIGHGASLMDLQRFGADFAYTLDGENCNEIEYECFNAAAAVVSFEGFNVHPGSAKNIMKNASLMAMEFNSMLPSGDTPAQTEGYEGFFHLTDMTGNVEKAELQYIIRDHSATAFSHRKYQMEHIAALINEKYGDGACTLKMRDQYRNMREEIEKNFFVVDVLKDAIRMAGLEPKCLPIRGGTDGAALTYRGLPCPNMGTGGHAFHGPYEHACREDMETMVDICMNVVSLCAKKSK